ncbi:hypothetical protein CHARACLAT_020047 [Characodon lateralis]|uniref:Uncharacterized protein n=1 Tax=Characodon lateralis TaxID=208331 RepID=A0ABU7E1Z9_9TELE|nr:hypothetical protein [Characodon lateralis]
MCVQRENAHEERGRGVATWLESPIELKVLLGWRMFAESSGPSWSGPSAQGILLKKKTLGDEKQSRERKGGCSLRGQSDCIDRISRKGRQVGAKAGCLRRGGRLDVSADVCVHVFVYKVLKEKVLEQDGC